MVLLNPKNFGEFPDIMCTHHWNEKPPVRNTFLNALVWLKHSKFRVFYIYKTPPVCTACMAIAKISEFPPKYFHIFGSPSVHRIPRFNMLSLIYHMCCLYKLYIGVSRRLVINHARRILQNETGYCPKDNPSLIYLLVLTLR